MTGRPVGKGGTRTGGALRRPAVALAVAALVGGGAPPPAAAAPAPTPMAPGLVATGASPADTTRYLTVGLYLASPEEGARVATFVRLLPPGHPETAGHDYPTAARLHREEAAALERIGEAAGLGLRATLLRHPASPGLEWSYWPRYSLPPTGELAEAEVRRFGAREAPVPGLRAVAFADGFPLAYLVDTRGMSLEARGMDRATSSGLDISRAAFLEALARAARMGPGAGVWIAVFAGP